MENGSEHHRHPFKIRLAVGLCMLAMGFFGVIITDIKQTGEWDYWLIVAPIYALFSLFLSYYLHKRGLRETFVTLWHELFHWIGLILSVSLISYLVKIGLIGRFEASLEVLTLLALATYLAGIYIELTFLPIGLALGLFTATIAFFDEYLYSIIVPLLFLAIMGIYLLLKFEKKMKRKSDL